MNAHGHLAEKHEENAVRACACLHGTFLPHAVLRVAAGRAKLETWQAGCPCCCAAGGRAKTTAFNLDVLSMVERASRGGDVKQRLQQRG